MKLNTFTSTGIYEMLVSKITIKNKNHEPFSIDFAKAGISIEFEALASAAIPAMEKIYYVDYYIVYSGDDIIYVYNGVV